MTTDPVGTRQIHSEHVGPIKVGNITYVLVNSWSVGFHAPKAPLNVTLDGQVKTAVEGQNVFILDDVGKEIERPLVVNIADPAVP